ncbi:dTDP-4-dehydrorhamnose reductase [Bradyrhizobium guangdongense]|uniref:dTDP-4-dehydrorhamnose reductase n=1 Tax=Bradyrhizobium guangdongense TaxID=1325090 RepID=UPI00112E6319|nr:dTDP-4-dehydrorhamnose reductase [Bradyrhizobium guangdongense]TPQ30214.1 dTDP-4-dehydrorhamnose reductase [Bradyrhizobium guangdongense]
MRILLTGRSGQVGGALLPRLGENHDVLAPSRDQFDLGRPECLAAELDRLRPDLIVNPAAFTAVERAEDEPDLAFTVNAGAPQAMARWAARHDVPLIHFSTDYVFDGSGEAPWREDDACNPLSAYGRSKWEGEKAVQTSGASHLIIRTSWVYSAGRSNFLQTINRLAYEREELQVVADQFGAPTSAASIGQAVATIIAEHPSQRELAKLFARARGVVHLTNSGSTSWHGFASAIVEALRTRGMPIKAKSTRPMAACEYRARVARPANSRLDLTRLREAFGVVMPSWQEALESELDLLCGAK